MTAPEEMQRILVLVEGRVQGVGYRMFVREIGKKLGLTGWARNLPDGRVEVEAQGSPSLLEELHESLWSGPPLAHVVAIRVYPASLRHEESTFRIHT